MKNVIWGFICLVILAIAVNVNAEVVKTFTEGDLVKLELSATDPDGDPLTYTFTKPLDNNGEWQTKAGDAGEYTVTVTASDGKALTSLEVKIVVLKKDSPPVFEPILQGYVNENDVLAINVKATDADGDEITYSAESLPNGASFSGNVFTYNPDYNVVSRSLIAKTLNNLKIHYKQKKGFDVKFIAQANGLKTEMQHKIKVVDVNRAPVLNDVSGIVVNEGDIVEIKPTANDPDDDTINFAYSGWMDKNTYQTTFDDAGEHTVTVTASDGLNAVSKEVKIVVNDANRQPEFKPLRPISVNEGKTASVELHATDPDDDEVTFSLANPPENAVIEDNQLSWKPIHATTDAAAEWIGLDLQLSDGVNKVNENVTFIVHNINQEPVIGKYSPDSSITVAKGGRVVFRVTASDPDGDELLYYWQFSPLNKIKSTPAVARTFTLKGDKKVKVIVTDGKDSVEKVWDVKVI